MLSDSLRALGRTVGGLRRARTERRAATAAREHEVGPAARAGLPDPADLRHVGLGGQTYGSGAA